MLVAMYGNAHGSFQRLHQPQSAASTQPVALQSTILKFGADGSLDIGQLKSFFGMELGTTVTLKAGTSGGDVWHIAKVEGQTITLVADEKNNYSNGG